MQCQRIFEIFILNYIEDLIAYPEWLPQLLRLSLVRRFGTTLVGFMSKSKFTMFIDGENEFRKRRNKKIILVVGALDTL